VIVAFSSGAAFDLYGRKKPLAFFFVCMIVGWIVLPLGWGASDHTLWKGYFVSSVLIGFIKPLSEMPYVPDLI